MSPLFDIDIVNRDDTVIVVVRGEIDLATAPRLDAALSRAEASAAAMVVLDLERVTFMDARGLGILVRHASLEEHAGRLRITPGPPQVQRLFELSGLRTHLPFYCLN
jgi:anti-sigma B factor antagonist